MLTSKKTTLKPLLESTEGVHLTCYLVNNGNPTNLKSQLRETIKQAYSSLSPVLSTDERNKFLEPLNALLLDSRIFKEIKGNIGIFRSKNLFRLLSIPIKVEKITQIATSFHVKPLLRWLQSDQEFLFLGLEKDSAHLYSGSQSSFKLVDTILFPEDLKKRHSGDHLSIQDLRRIRLKENQTFSWLDNWISELTMNTKPKLFLAGEKSFVTSLNRKLKYSNVLKSPVSDFFSTQNINDLISSVRKIMRTESRKSLEKSLFEFHLAEESNLIQRNIFQISKSVVEGRIRKLLVTDDLNIFGKIDKKSGGISIHPFDLDHEDDDILDDLAQMVLRQGGEVTVAAKNEIPHGSPILAILNNTEKDLEKTKEYFKYDFSQERLV